MKILYHFRTQGTGAEGVHIAGVAGAFDLFADLLNEVRIGCVEQDARRIPHQAPRPASDDDGPDNAHGGVEEGPSGVFARDERDDCQD